MGQFTIHQLAQTIADRMQSSAEDSYSAKLAAGGVELCARKFGEESIELVIAALNGDHRAMTAEAADLMYHFLALLEVGGVSLDEVLAELERRTGQSGLAEKAARDGGAQAGPGSQPGRQKGGSD